MSRVIGIIILLVGVVVLYFAYQSASAPVDQAVTAVTGSHTNTTITYLIAGIAAVVGGAALVLYGRRSIG
jgi:hypothetical protein